MQISVVIPTCDRKQRLLSLLHHLDQSSYPLHEVIIVDSGSDKLLPADYGIFKNIAIRYFESEKSVCRQRNIGIANAEASWIFLCDDDIEPPADYLEKIVAHIDEHREAVAVSGVWLQFENGKWVSEYPVRSNRELVWKYIFQLSIWGKIECGDNFISRRLKKYYRRKGNHISKAGWPVLTDFSGLYFTTPLYSLGASVVRKEWLVKFPYDEILDSHGIGDNYGVAINFPPGSIHILNNTFVFHHREPLNRLQKPLQYFRRSLALDYFASTNGNLKHVRRINLLWSLKGNLLSFLWAGDIKMMRAAFKTLVTIAFKRNTYLKRSFSQKKLQTSEYR
jgi:glycosyltransferase involved in cell wall biosynthesis